MKRPEGRTFLRWSGPVLLLGALLLIRIFGDGWWPALPLLYGPRWPLAFLVLTPLLAFRRGAGRRTIAALTTALLACVLLLDFRLPWRAVLPHGGGQTHPMRVLAWNVQGGGPDVAATVHQIRMQNPDVAIISECASAMSQALAEVVGATLLRSAGLCLLTTLPVVEWAPRDPSDFWRMAGSGAIVRLVVNVADTEVVVGGVHLETPRGALEALAKRAFFSFPGAASENQAARDVESEVARTWIAPVDEIRPVVVAGDFNLVSESAIYRRWWGDLDNAFGQYGLGLGWTKQTRWFGARIDHVLAGNGVRVERVTMGDLNGADHRPLIVDLEIPVGPVER